MSCQPKKLVKNLLNQRCIKNLNKRRRQNEQTKITGALDHNDLEQALADVFQVGDIVDIIEIGTILCLQEGAKPSAVFVACSRKQLLLIQNVRMPETVAKNVTDAGADFMTVICCATLPTMEAAQNEVKALQVELYGDWTYEQAAEWRRIGIQQVIYHQSREMHYFLVKLGENGI